MPPRNFNLQTVTVAETGLEPRAFQALMVDAQNLFQKAPALSAIGLYASADDYDDEVYSKVDGSLIYAVDALGFDGNHGQAIAATDAFAAQALYLAEKSWSEIIASMIDLEEQHNYDEEFANDRFILLTRNGPSFFTTDPRALMAPTNQVQHVVRKDRPWAFLYAIQVDGAGGSTSAAQSHSALLDALPHLTKFIDKL